MNPPARAPDLWSLPPARDDEDFPLLTEIVADHLAEPAAPVDPMQQLERELSARLDILLDRQRAEAEDALRAWLDDARSEARARTNLSGK